VEEALGNIIKHSGAARASVQVGRCDAGLQLEIRDNGLASM
jgi:signal transduction histidine kinase